MLEIGAGSGYAAAVLSEIADEVFAIERIGILAEEAERHLKNEGYDNVHVLPLNDLVCPNKRCAAQRTDGLTVFRDNRHLTESFVKALVPDVLRRLKQIKAEPA